MEQLLEVRNLVTRFHTDQGVVHAVNGISWSVAAGEALAIVGESGSGKSVGVLSILGLIPQPPGEVESGKALFRGQDLIRLSSRELRRIRGREIAMVFQDPMTSLNPVLTVGCQMTEPVRAHTGATAREAARRAEEMMEMVGIPDAGRRLRDYPHRFSGGQRQRILIAMALACSPSVLIADEPTTALDVTIQAQIVGLVKQLQKKLGMAIIWITHDLALIAGLADKVAVMYAGRIVEQAPVGDIFRRPAHPYTLGLLHSLPKTNAPVRRRLTCIPGSPPDLRQRFRHCPFAPRCSYVIDRCRRENPSLITAGANHTSACWRREEVLEEMSHEERR